jgi:hypothetical protein
MDDTTTAATGPIAPAAISSEPANGGGPYISGLAPLPVVSPLTLRRGSPPGFPTLASPTWSHAIAPSALPNTASPLVDTLATIQAAVTASRERERTASLALERERALGAALTTQMATTQRLLGHPCGTPGGPPRL